MAYKDSASLEGSLLNYNLRFRKELKQLLDLGLAGTEEHSSLLVIGVVAHTLLAAYFDNKVGAQIKQDLVLTEEGVLWQL